jgi:hypothetical protein
MRLLCSYDCVAERAGLFMLVVETRNGMKPKPCVLS